MKYGTELSLAVGIISIFTHRASNCLDPQMLVEEIEQHTACSPCLGTCLHHLCHG